MYSLKLMGAYIEVTSKCNRECPYCYNDSSHKGEHLPKAIIKKVIDECLAHGINHITISGGEPFLHPEIDAIIELLDRNGMIATFITNLSVVSIQRVIELAEKGHLFQVTLDHTDREINDITRGRGSYDLVLKLLNKLKEKHLSNSVILRFNLSKTNSDVVEKLLDLTSQYDVKTLDLAILFASGRGKTYGAVFSYEEDILLIGRLVKRLKELKEKYISEINITYSTIENQVGCVLYGEGDLYLGIKIEPNGDVYACQLFSGKENVLGNAAEDSLQSILNSGRARAVVDRIRTRKNRQTKCDKCGFTNLCMCGCPAASYNQTDSIFAIYDQCSMIKFFMKEKIKDIH